MGGAGTAGALHLLTQFAAGAEEADVEGVDPLAAGLGDVGGGFAFEVDTAEQFGVGLWQGGEELHDALAEGFFVIGVGGIGRLTQSLFATLARPLSVGLTIVAFIALGAGEKIPHPLKWPMSIPFIRCCKAA